MGSPAQIREALAVQITAATGLRSLTDPGSIANPPVAVVLPAQGKYIDYETALAPNVYDITLRVLILVSRADERIAVPLLDSYLEPYGATSVPAAILADQTLGGVCDFCVPVQANGLLPFSWAGVDYYAAEILVQAGAE